jgi:hypothetical protein
VSTPTEADVLRAWQTGKAPLPGERYEHDGGGAWEVLVLSLAAESGEVLVTARQLPSGFHRTWALSHWLEEVDGRPRFRRVGRAEG